MIRQIGLFLSVLLLTASCTERVDRTDIVGSYNFKSGATDYESFELAEDGSFQSWLHERPEVFGTWSLDDGIIKVKENGNINISMKVISVSEKELVVKQAKAGGAGIYSRIYSHNK